MNLEKKPRASGVSVAMKTTMDFFQKGIPLVEKPHMRGLTIKIANTLEEREAVFRLGYQIYLEKKFINENSQEWLVLPHDSDRDTTILIVQDAQKRIAGSVTLVFSEASKLPAEKTYKNEIRDLKANGEKMVEISRLVINPEFRNSKEILVLLFNYLAIFSYHVKKYTSLVIEVNPRHKNYYKALLNFDEIGEEKACHIVKDAPAVLLYLPLSRYQSETIRCISQKNCDKKERSLCQYFLNPEQELLVSDHLAKQVKPMTESEKIYFGLSDTSLEIVALC